MIIYANLMQFSNVYFLMYFIVFISYYIYCFISNVFFCSEIHQVTWETYKSNLISIHISHLGRNTSKPSTFWWHAHTNCHVTPYRYIRFWRKWYQNVRKTWREKVMKQQFKIPRGCGAISENVEGGLPDPPPPPPPPSTVYCHAWIRLPHVINYSFIMNNAQTLIISLYASFHEATQLTLLCYIEGI